MFEGDSNRRESPGVPQQADFHPIVPNPSDSEVISILMKVGVDSPAIFGLVWGNKMGAPKSALFPRVLTETVQDIEKHLEKKKTAYDTAEVKLHAIIVELLQVAYEKQVNDIVAKIIRK